MNDDGRAARVNAKAPVDVRITRYIKVKKQRRAAGKRAAARRKSR